MNLISQAMNYTGNGKHVVHILIHNNATMAEITALYSHADIARVS